jgi:hypothetical protein
MAGFFNFRDPSLEGVEVTYIHPCKSKGGLRCNNKPNKKDRLMAAKLRRKVLSSLANGELLVPDLRTYAELCCCLLAHRKTAIKVGTPYQVAQCWTSELAGQSNVSITVSIPAPTLPRFLSYTPREPGDNLNHVLSSTLSEDEFRPGTIYMVRRLEDPGFVKIGITYKIADYRFSFFTSACGFEPIPLRQIRHVPYVRRVERLVHTELKSYRRGCTTCINRAECETLHTECVQVKEEVAPDIMEAWARWANYADPYSVDGKLEASWMDLELEIRHRGQLPTSDKITKELQAQQVQQAQENAFVSLFANMSLRRKLLSRKEAAH